MVERMHGMDAPAQGVELVETPDAELSAEERPSASSQLSQNVERPNVAAIDNELLKQFEPAEAMKASPESAKPAPAAEGRSVSELAKDPGVRAALEKALTDGTIKYQSLKDVVKGGLETGEFNFKSAGQERALKEIIAPAITAEPAKPTPTVEAPEPVKAGPEAPGAENAPAKAPEAAQSQISKAIADIDTKMPNGLDERVKNALVNSSEISGLENPPYQRGDSYQTAKPSLGDATRYANQMAVKTNDFEPASVQANFKQAFEQPSKDSLYKLAEDQGVRLYPKAEPKPEGAGRAVRDVNAAIKPDSIYGRAIDAAKAKGVELPAPADPAKGYTLGEARELKEQKLIDLDSVTVARETPNRAVDKPMAGPEDSKKVIDTLNAGFDKNGAVQKGIPFDQFKSLSAQSKNEVRALVGKLDGAEAAGGLLVTAALAKEFKEKVLKEQDHQTVGASA